MGPLNDLAASQKIGPHTIPRCTLLIFLIINVQLQGKCEDKLLHLCIMIRYLFIKYMNMTTDFSCKIQEI